MGIINNITNNYPTNKCAAMYYKTEPYYTNVDAYVHTNNWEILESIRILNKKGYSVDLIDRGVGNWNPGKKYDLFLGLGVGNTGAKFPKFASISQAPIKILLAMGPQPDISAKRTIERYQLFNKRNNSNIPTMRVPDKVTGKTWNEILNAADYIFNIGEVGTQSYNSYLPYLSDPKTILSFYPSISPKVTFNQEWKNTRDLNSFLCFAGNGFICKGVDLVLDAFLKDKSKTLHICGPTSERAFFERYNKDIQNAPNVIYHGFIEPGGQTFNLLASKCSFTIFHSASEGCCTSVATSMKAGLVPIINRWTGINITDEGFVMSDEGDLDKVISESINKASNLDREQYKKLVSKTLNKATMFSQQSFTESYTKALSRVLEG
ncbi:MAG: glycosyltransferase [Candidatus Hodarchaeales archaeon]|jgi:glycosyltransferase involved in cell wall biosynthesis